MCTLWVVLYEPFKTSNTLETTHKSMGPTFAFFPTRAVICITSPTTPPPHQTSRHRVEKKFWEKRKRKWKSRRERWEIKRGCRVSEWMGVQLTFLFFHFFSIHISSSLFFLCIRVSISLSGTKIIFATLFKEYIFSVFYFRKAHIPRNTWSRYSLIKYLLL